MVLFYFIFFFSSRRRHTRCLSDWSSDVCSSDLVGARTSSPDTPAEGTVVLDVEQGGIVVPSFAGKSVRSAIEIAEESGLDLDAVGSGIAREQSPPAGSHVAAGSRVTVRFGR